MTSTATSTITELVYCSGALDYGSFGIGIEAGFFVLPARPCPHIIILQYTPPPPKRQAFFQLSITPAMVLRFPRIDPAARFSGFRALGLWGPASSQEVEEHCLPRSPHERQCRCLLKGVYSQNRCDSDSGYRATLVSTMLKCT